MAAMERLCQCVGINLSKVSKSEASLLEAELFASICAELKEAFRKQYREYFRLMKFTLEKENIMLDANFLRLIIKDILASGEYDLKGIACYINTHVDVIQDVIDGMNPNPSLNLMHRSIDLHRLVRRDLYDAVWKKVVTQKLFIKKYF